MKQKKWQITEPISQEIKDNFPELNPLVLQLLVNRNITTQKEIDEFLGPDYGTHVHDPFLFVDMQKAVERIFTAIETKQKILVYGDYDADGVTSSAIMVSTLQALGGDVDIYIPFRETEGYGLNLEAVKSIAEMGVQLVVTVDCAIANVEEVKALQEQGIDTIVTDHHQEPLELPDAYAIINPNTERESKYPFKSLAGCGVAFKVAQALIDKHTEYDVVSLKEGWEKWLLDLVAIGTVADMMPLVGENRTLVKYGLIVLRKTKRIGIQQLVQNASVELKNLTEQSIGFQIAPRLNAAGRLNHASTAYNLLITESTTEAQELASEVHQTNLQRQRITEDIVKQSLTSIGDPDDPKNEKIMIAVGNDWPTGVVGLAAGRLMNKFDRPVMILSRFNGQIIGSGRSIESFNMIKALQQLDQYLGKYGGHAQACGLTIETEENLEKFIAGIHELAGEITEQDLLPSISIDTQAQIADVNWDMFESLELFEPYGKGNPQPVFCAKDVQVVEVDCVGKDDKHLRMKVTDTSGVVRKVIGFGFGWCKKEINAGDTVNIAFEVDVNEWNGNRELQLKLVDVHKN